MDIDSLALLFFLFLRVLTALAFKFPPRMGSGLEPWHLFSFLQPSFLDLVAQVVANTFLVDGRATRAVRIQLIILPFDVVQRGPDPGQVVSLHAIGSETGVALIGPIRLVLDRDPPVFADSISHLVVEIRDGIRMQSKTIRLRMIPLLPSDNLIIRTECDLGYKHAGAPRKQHRRQMVHRVVRRIAQR